VRRPGARVVRGGLAPLALLLGCAAEPPEPTPEPLPGPYELDERVDPPDARTFFDGEPVDLEAWPARRAELTALFDR
jgi:hypothetical protein